jgi:hypothetical protein
MSKAALRGDDDPRCDGFAMGVVVVQTGGAW